MRLVDIGALGMIVHTNIGELSYDGKGDVKKADYAAYRWNKQPDGRITHAELK